MGGRAIKKTYAVLHADTILFVLIALFVTGVAFLQNTGILTVVLRALPFVLLMGVTESLAYRLRMQRKAAWVLVLLFLLTHFVLAAAVYQGIGLEGFVVPQGLPSKIVAGYFVLSALYGFLGLLSRQTLHNFFGTATKV